MQVCGAQENAYNELKGFYDRLYDTHMRSIDRNAHLRGKIRELEMELAEARRGQ